MSKVTFKGKEIDLKGEFPQKGDKATDFRLVSAQLEEKSLADFKGKRKLILTVPSLDTDVCATCAKKLNGFALEHPDDIVLIVSADLPFAQKRFCNTEGLNNLVTLSMMRDKQFAHDYGVYIQSGPLEGLCARALLILDRNDKIIYSQLVPEIAQEPDYDDAFSLL